MRTEQLFNENWVFIKDGVSEQIQIPHTWNAADGQGTSDYYRGTCQYQKKFPKTECGQGQRVYLEFRGVNASAKVEINGNEVTAHDGGYSTFRADITDFLQEENTLDVYVDNSVNETVYPQKADFTFYGGIYRDVYMILVDETHFDLDYYGGKGLYITPVLEGEEAEIQIEAYVRGNAEKVVVSIYDK